MAKIDNLTEIVAGCKKGDSECFSQLVDAYSGRFYGYFYRLTGNRDISDDLLSELFVKLVVKIGSFKGEAFETWLFRVATNIFHDYLRKKQRQGKLLDARKDDLQEQAEQKRHSEDVRIDDLQRQLGNLDEDTRQLIMLRFYSQLSFKELAKMRGEPIGTTLAKVHRGLKKLRELMEQ